jgi:hypothetical protein
MASTAKVIALNFIDMKNLRARFLMMDWTVVAARRLALLRLPGQGLSKTRSSSCCVGWGNRLCQGGQ